MKRIFGIVTLILLMLTGSSSARVWYVEPDSTGQAINIQAGIDSCAAGDTVVAMPGIYTGEGNWDIDFKGKPIVVMGAASFDSTITDKTIMDGLMDHHGFYFHSNEDSTSVLSGFITQRMRFAAIECEHSSPTILQNEISGGQSISCHDSSPKLIGNLLHGRYGISLSCNGGSPYVADNRVFVDDCGSSLACNDFIFENCISLQLRGNLTGSGYVTNCTGIIDGNRFGPGYGGLYISGSTLTITNNEIHSIRYTALGCEGSAVIVANNQIMGGDYSSGIIVMSGSLPSMVVNNDIGSGEGNNICGINYSGDSTSVIEDNIIHDIQGWGIKCYSSVRIAGNLIFSNFGYAEDQGGIYCEASPVIDGNTIVGSAWAYGGNGIYCAPGSCAAIKNNIIANFTMAAPGESGKGIYTESPSIVVSCCNVYNNEVGNYVGIPDQTGLNGNISQDPLFCDLLHKDFSLHTSSPCLPGNHPNGADCGLMGARGIGCDYVSTLLQSWFAAYAGGGITMTWTLTEEPPLSSFSIWREELPDGQSELIGNPQLSREGLAFTFRDTEVLPGTKIRYRVELSNENSTETLFETETIAVPAMPLSLEQNFPNPFNPQTYIRYYVPSPGRVSIEVYDAAGRQVARIFDKVQEKGFHVAIWDGRDGNGVSVNSGVYFYRLAAGKQTLSKKMVLLK